MSWRGIGCTLYAMFALVASAFLALLSIFGQCGAWAPPDCQQPSTLQILAFFPGGPIVLIAGGLLMMKFVLRSRDVR